MEITFITKALSTLHEFLFHIFIMFFHTDHKRNHFLNIYEFLRFSSPNSLRRCLVGLVADLYRNLDFIL